MSDTPTGSSTVQHLVLLTKEQADQQLTGIQASLKAKGLNSTDLASLERLHAQSPSHEGAILLLTKLYVERKDWNGLTELLESLPDERRSGAYSIECAGVLAMGHRYAEAFEIINPMVQDDGACSSLDAAWLCAHSGFHAGEMARAQSVLDVHLPEFIKAGRLDALAMRGLIDFRYGRFESAIDYLEQLLEKDPEHTAGHNALGRVLVAAGELERGKQHLDRAGLLRRQFKQREKQTLRLAAISKLLQAAWELRDYASCEQYINELLPHVDDKKRQLLYERLATLYDAQGREPEAEETRQKAQGLFGENR